ANKWGYKVTSAKFDFSFRTTRIDAAKLKASAHGVVEVKIAPYLVDYGVVIIVCNSNFSFNINSHFTFQRSYDFGTQRNNVYVARVIFVIAKSDEEAVHRQVTHS